MFRLQVDHKSIHMRLDINVLNNIFLLYTKTQTHDTWHEYAQ